VIYCDGVTRDGLRLKSYCDIKLDLASSDNNIPLSFEQQQNAKTSDYYANTTANTLLGDSAYRKLMESATRRQKVDFIHFVFCFLIAATLNNFQICIL